MTLTDLLQQSAEKWPFRTALRMRMGYRTVALTFSEVAEMSRKVATFLESQGLEKGDRVLILAPNSPYWICVFFGCLLRGCIAVPLNVQSTAEMVRKIAEQTDATVLFKYRHFTVDLPENLKVFTIDYLPELLEDISASEDSVVFAHPGDTVELLYTSGTTGDPKGVILTHENLTANLRSIAQVLKVPPEARLLSILPLSHSFEQTVGFLLPFSSGAEIIYSHSPAAIGDLLKEHRITHLIAVPEFLQVLMGRLEELTLSQRLKGALSSRLKTVASGGAALDPELEKKWRALGIKVLQGYGLTETAPIVTANTYAANRVGSVGKPLPDVEVKIADDGEILVQGPNVFQGYYKDEHKTSTVFRNDWFKTGDIGEFDDDGFLFIKGRKKYMIKGPGAQNVYPEDIEEALNHVSGLRDSCVVGLDEAIHAVLLLADDVDPEEAERIVEEANEKLASYQRITSWSLWPEDDFPRSATRKVQKEKVLTWLRERGEEARPTEMVPATPLTRLLSQVSGIPADQIHDDTNLVRDLHIDSLLRIELVYRIELRFGKEIEEAQVTEQTIVADLKRFIEDARPRIHEPLKRWPRWRFITALRIVLQLLIVFPLFRIVMRLKVNGKENLQKISLPVIFMPNHVSYLDGLALVMALPLTLRARLAFAAARDFVYGEHRRKAPLLELLFNTFPFPRKEGENIRPGLEHAGRLLDAGCCLAFFPEGQLSESGALLPLKRGTGLVAVEMHVPVVPVKIEGSNAVLPYATYIPRKRGTVTVIFGDPMEFKMSDSYGKATERIEEVMKNLSAKKS